MAAKGVGRFTHFPSPSSDSKSLRLKIFSALRRVTAQREESVAREPEDKTSDRRTVAPLRSLCRPP